MYSTIILLIQSSRSGAADKKKHAAISHHVTCLLPEGKHGH